MSLKIDFSKRATVEIDEAYNWYESQLLGLGNAFLEELEKSVAKISSNPTYYGFADETKTIRDLLVKPYPYLIVYEIFENSILIHSVFQSRQHPNKKFRKR